MWSTVLSYNQTEKRDMLMDTQLAPIAPHSLSTAQFAALSAIPPEAEWFANLRNRHTRENYLRDIRQLRMFQRCWSAILSGRMRLRGYPETLLSYLNDLKQHSCGNETQGYHKMQAS
jgi:hypothetical protein